MREFVVAWWGMECVCDSAMRGGGCMLCSEFVCWCVRRIDMYVRCWEGLLWYAVFNHGASSLNCGDLCSACAQDRV